MSMVSIKFVIFLLAVFTLYFVAPQKYKSVFLLIANYVFYALAVPQYLLIMIFSTAITYGAARWIELKSTLKEKRSILALVIVINIGLIIVFKYFNFFGNTIETLSSVLGLRFSIPEFSIIQPLGISFYILQVIGYMIDVYRGKIKSEKNILIYALYVSFFPQIGAGPIGRAAALIPQFREEHKLNVTNVSKGLQLILLGAFKKIAIADTLAIYVNYFFDNLQTNHYQGATIIIAMILYSIQIYCDFSGYSDMASGCARLLGFKLMENFNAPYLSKSIVEFWRRWHISLSSWFKDYLYIPLGGSRNGFFRKCINALIIFLVSGLWHGASINFIVWGFLHGFFWIFEESFHKLWKGHVLFAKPILNKIKSMVQILITFSLVTYAWIFFRAQNLQDALYAASNIFVFEIPSATLQNLKAISTTSIGGSYSLAAFFLISIVFFVIMIILIDHKDQHKEVNEYVNRDTNLFAFKNSITRYILYYCFGMIIITWYFIQNATVGQQSQFIYFQF